MLLREKLVRAELAAARLNIREVGPNNHGPWVKKFLAEVGLPEGYAWCDAFQSYEMHAVAGRRLPIESASVWVTYNTARRLGWTVSTPARGDLVLYDFDGDGQTDDHIEIVTGVSRVPGGWKLNTVGGNTGDGSAADGDGVYVRTRIVKRSSVAFVRIPGYVPDPPKPAVKKAAPVVRSGSSGGTGRVVAKPKPKPARKPAPKPKPRPKPAPPPRAATNSTSKLGDRGDRVRTLQRLLKHAGFRIVTDGVFGKATLGSVRAFQKRHGLKTDGICGGKTWAALNKAAGQ